MVLFFRWVVLGDVLLLSLNFDSTDGRNQENFQNQPPWAKMGL